MVKLDRSWPKEANLRNNRYVVFTSNFQQFNMLLLRQKPEPNQPKSAAPSPSFMKTKAEASEVVKAIKEAPSVFNATPSVGDLHSQQLGS